MKRIVLCILGIFILLSVISATAYATYSNSSMKLVPPAALEKFLGSMWQYEPGVECLVKRFKREVRLVCPTAFFPTVTKRTGKENYSLVSVGPCEDVLPISFTCAFREPWIGNMKLLIGSSCRLWMGRNITNKESEMILARIECDTSSKMIPAVIVNYMLVQD